MNDRSVEGSQTVAVLFIDLDDFKYVNDTLGHDLGDMLLVEVAKRLKESVRLGDLVARLGGDEFAVLLANLDGLPDAMAIAERIVASLRVPLSLGDALVEPRGTVGIATARNSGITAEKLLSQADIAMYMAKARGKNGIEVFRSEMHGETVERMRRRSLLDGTLERDELSVLYQPIFDLATREVVGVEALLHWNHPSLGVLPPEMFIDDLDNTRAGRPAGAWMLKVVAKDFEGWKRHSPPSPFMVVISASPRQLADPRFSRQLATVLKRTIPASDLVIALHDTPATDLVALRERLVDLSQPGVRIAVSDFLANPQTAGYLTAFPVGFVTISARPRVGFQGGNATGALVNAIVRFSSTMGIETIATGVDDEATLSALMSYGCEFGRGSALAPVMTHDELATFLSSQTERTATNAGPMGA